MALFGRTRARRALERATLARNFGQPDEAYDLAEKALRLDPSCEPAQELVARLLPRDGDLPGAIDRLQALLDGGARAPRVGLALAACLLAAERPEDALVQLRARLPEDAGVEDQIDRLRYRARAQLDLERWSDAVDELQQLETIDAGHPVLHDLAHALENAGRNEDALGVRRSLARFRPDDWYRFVRTLHPDQREATASVLGLTEEQLLDLAPIDALGTLPPEALDEQFADLPQPWRAALHGHAHRAAERNEPARAVLAKAADHPAARYESALLDMCSDTIERSVEALEQLSEQALPLPGLAYWRAVAHHAAGHDATAASLYRALLDEDLEHGHAWWLLADVLDRLEGPDARRQTQHRALKATPLLLVQSLRSQLTTIVGVAGRVRMGRLPDDDPTLVTACNQAGDRTRAQALLRQWSRREDVAEPVRIQLARDGLGAQAHEAIATLLAPLVEAEHPEALALAGEAMVVGGKPRLGAERLRRATQLDPTLTRAWDFLGVVHAQRNEWAEAEQPLHEAVRLGPDGPDRQRNLAALLLDTQRGAEAVAPAESAVAMLPPEGSTLALLARAYEAAGDHQWASLAAWAANYHMEQHLHRSALGGIDLPLPGNVPPPPRVFRPTIRRFQRRLQEISRQL